MHQRKKSMPPYQDPTQTGGHYDPGSSLKRGRNSESFRKLPEVSMMNSSKKLSQVKKTKNRKASEEGLTGISIEMGSI